MGDFNHKLTILPLWDMLDGYYIALDDGINYKNVEKEIIVRRILPFAAHPSEFLMSLSKARYRGDRT